MGLQNPECTRHMYQSAVVNEIPSFPRKKNSKPMVSRNHFPPVEPVTTLSPSWSTSGRNDAEIAELATYFVALLIATILGVVMMVLQFRGLSRKIQQRRRRRNQPKQRHQQRQRFNPFQTTRQAQAPTKQAQEELLLSLTHGQGDDEWDLMQQSHRRDKQQLARDIQAITQLQSEVTQQLSQLKGVLQHLQQQQRQQQQQQQQQPQSAETNREKND